MENGEVRQLLTDVAAIKVMLEALRSRIDERLIDIAQRCAVETHSREMLDERVRKMEMDDTMPDRIGRLENKHNLLEQRLQMQSGIISSLTSGALFAAYQVWEWLRSGK